MLVPLERSYVTGVHVQLMPPKRSSKAVRTFAIRCTDDDLAILRRNADKAGCNQSDYARKRILGDDPDLVAWASHGVMPVDHLPGSVAVLPHWHVDDLGDDHLRMDNGAMGR